MNPFAMRCLWCLIFSGVNLEVLSLSPRSENCTDIPGWVDSEGYTCAEYINKSWCTPDGNTGPGWTDPEGGLEDLWNEGFSAQAACCSCGGGQVTHIAGMWEVMRGSCTVEGSCLMSPNYPDNYSTGDDCIILVNNSLAQPLKVLSWDVEYWYDYLKINNRDFSGSYQPDGLIPNGSIYWVSDEDITGKGWKICGNNSQPEIDSAIFPTSTSTTGGSTTSSDTSSPTTVVSMNSTMAISTTVAMNSTTSSPSSSSTGATTSSSATTVAVESTTTESRQCQDVDGWSDSADFACAEYVAQKWCTEGGARGTEWNPMWGDIEEYWSEGFSALEACCACGGGKVKSIPDLWMVLSGLCTVVDGCIQSPNYPSNYSNNQRCTILVNETLAKPIEVVSFDTEYGYDKLVINGRPFSGRRKPLKVVPHYAISWESDEDTTDKGWKLCPGRHFPGPGLFLSEGPCTVDSEGCVLSPNFPQNYGPNQDCAIQVFNPNNRSIVVENFATEMLYDVLWVNGRMYAGKSSPHGLVPTEAIQWSTDEDTEDSGWKICPGPVGQQVANVGGLDPDEGKEDEDEYGYGATSVQSSASPRPTDAPSGGVYEEESGFVSGNFIFKAGLAAIALCLGAVLCLRLKRRNAGREEYGTRYGRSYVLDNL